MWTIDSSVRAARRRSGRADGSSMPRRKTARSLICIAAQSAMFLPRISDDRAVAFSRVPPHDGQAERWRSARRPRGQLAWSESSVLDEVRPSDLVDEADVGEVEVLELDLRLLAVEEALPLGVGEVAQRLVGVEEAGVGVDAVVPRAGLEAREGDGALVQATCRRSTSASMSTVDIRPSPSHSAHIPPVIVICARLGLRLSLLERDLAADRAGRDVEAERAGRTDVRLAEPAEDHPQHVVGIGRGADGRARIGAHPLLVDDDRGRQVLERIDVRPRRRRP